MALFYGFFFGNGGEVAGHSGLGFDRSFSDGWVYCLAWVMQQMGYDGLVVQSWDMGFDSEMLRT